ncbi:HK97 family phage prohead protease [Rhodobacterales bacterium HKCCE3408]|nr:HK97 family phage prohead protease [Rhodobacterales bacterium HKCCE3408]
MTGRNVSDVLHHGLALETRATGDGIVEGVASPFGSTPDSYGDVVARGAFSKSIESRRPVFLWAHDPSRIVGKWEHLEERADGLHVRGRINLKTETGREAFEHLKAGDVDGLSIGFNAKRATVDRQTGHRTLTEIDLREISLVAMPAAETARVSSVKSIASPEELRDLLREAGLPHRASDKIARAGWHVGLKGMDPEEFERSLRQAAKKSADRRNLKTLAELLGEAAKGR